MVRGFTSTSWTFVFHSTEDKITRGHSWKLIKNHCRCNTLLQFFSQRVIGRVCLRKIFLCHQWTLLNIVSRKEIVRQTSLKTHSLQVLLAARVRKSDGFGQDGEGHRQIQPQPVSYSGGRRLNDSTSIQSVTFSRYGDATIKVSTIQALLHALQVLTTVRKKRMQQSKKNVNSRFWILKKT